jgi:hypothetical protein
MNLLIVSVAPVSQRYAEMLREMQEHDKEDKLEHKKSLREKKLQKKMKLKRKRHEETEAGSEDDSGSESEFTSFVQIMGDIEREREQTFILVNHRF